MPNSVSPISYTNKDFKSIYEEILTLAKELSYKWDPTISNESDPGVVLLKLNAIIGDKNNYNIDKNILEAFPETVTQETAARQLFNQLGYKMPWYRAASTNINLKWIGRELVIGETLDIPRFTMVTNDESDVVYTIVEPVQINRMTKNNTVTVKALQGTVVEYSVGGNKNIQSSNFDKLNRLYLKDYNVAENGVFISNINNKSVEWTMVDNINLYPTGSYVYEFNVDPRTNYCYLEFPEDFDVLIGSGINITYIATKGSQGNVKSRNLTKFFNDISVKLIGEEVALNSENIELYNNSAASDGSDPEDIDGAYRSYKRVVGTFDTLVTLRDYINAAYNSGLISNGVVSDRMTDIQTTYSIVTTNVESLNSELVQEKLDDNGHYQFVKVWQAYESDSTNPNKRVPTYSADTYYKIIDGSMTKITSDWETDSPPNDTNLYVLKSKDTTDLTAYDLRFYMLKNVNQITDLVSYNESFENIPSNDSTMSQLYGYIENLQCVQHNFKDILTNRYCMFKTIYPLNITVIPQYKLTDTQITTLKNNVFEALRKLLCSSNVDFGTEPDYDTIYSTIEKADSRIKFIMMDDFQFTTYAVYWDGSKFKEIPISEFTADNIIFGDTAKLTEELSYSKNKNCYFINSEKITKGIDDLIFADKRDYEAFSCFVVENNKLKLYSDKIQEFRTDIIAKSVLAGITSLFNVDNRFSYSVDKQVVDNGIIEDIYKVTTKLTISPFGGEVSDDDDDVLDEAGKPTGITITPPCGTGSGTENRETTYILKENESLRFYGPSFKTSTSYSNYVKFMLILANATGFEYHITDFADNEIISIHNPVYLYERDMNTNNFSYKEYTTNANVMGNDGNSGTIIDLCNKGTLQVFKKVPSYTIPAEVDYKLHKGDQLIFFWRESQEDDSPYTYKKYVGIDESLQNRDDKGNLLKSPIISASFTIVATSREDSKISESQIPLETGTLLHSDAINSAYYIVSKMYGDNELSGSKTIDIKDITEAEMDTSDIGNRPYYYFVTNDKRDDKYYLTLNCDGDVSSATHYMSILDEDECFIQVSPTKNAYELYGPGTMIRISRSEEEKESETESLVLDVKAINYEDIINKGIDVLQDVVQQANRNIIIREQQMYSLTGGDTITITLEDNYFNSNSIQVIPKEDIELESAIVDEALIGNNALPNYMLPPTAALNTIKVFDNNVTLPYTISSATVKKGINEDGTDNYVTNNYVLPRCIVGTYTQITTEPTINEGNAFKYCHINCNEYNVIVNPSLGDTRKFVYKVDSNTILDTFKNITTTNVSTSQKYFIATPYSDYAQDKRQDLEDYIFDYNIKTGKYTPHSPTEDISDMTYVIEYPLSENDDNNELTYYMFDKGKYYICDGDNNEKTYTLLDTITNYTSNNTYTAYTIQHEILTKIDSMDEVYSISDCRNINLNASNYRVEYDDKIDTNYPVFTSDTYTNVSDMTISFSTDGTTSQSLPVSKVGDSDGSWKGTARLNIQSNSNKPQCIAPIDEYSGQVYYLQNSDGTYTPYYVSSETTIEKYISSNVDVSKVGGNNIDVSYVDLLGNRHGIDFQVYTKNSSMDNWNPDSYTSDDVGNLHLDMNVNNTYIINGIKCDEDYFYILPIQNNSLIGKFMLKVLNTDIPEYSYTIHDFDTEYGNGTYYFVLPSVESANIEVDIKIGDNSKLTLMPLIKYKEEPLFEDKYGITVTNIITRMQHFDKENKFRYNYVVPEDKLIMDPLLGKSFFNTNHIYNKFTIAKANLDTTRTTDGIKPIPNNSEIVVTSNR